MPYYPGKNASRHERSNAMCRCEFGDHDVPNGQMDTGSGGIAVCRACKRTPEYKAYANSLRGRSTERRLQEEQRQLQKVADDDFKDKEIPDSGYNRIRRQRLGH